MADRAAEDITAPKAEEAPPALTVAELRDLIREHALTGPRGRATRLRMPDDEALARLAAIVTQWTAHVRQARAEAEFQKSYRDANDAAATLREVLPIIGARLVAQANRGDPFARDRLLPPARHLFDAAMSFVAPPPPAWRAEGVRDLETPDWRHFARVLLAALLKRVTGDETAPARIGEVLRSKK